ncbi:NACHT domain-containing protein [Embleya sp. NPDC050154]|uniref:NACHT domain-containing protein n=1 Tax=Embleya sp. NPDC050154 TaxID=3363988 RepID=UPI0037A45BE0
MVRGAPYAGHHNPASRTPPNSEQLNLTRLGTRGFEQLVQGLALRVLGCGVEVFGDGRDGGREATFRGQLSFPDPAPEGLWSGYGVLQAKFRQRPLGTEADTDWFVDQVKKELNARAKALRADDAPERPDYMIFVTNVVLSPVSRAGGIDRVDREISGLNTRLGLGLVAWRVWHFDQLGSFLDGNLEVRQTYLGLITTGDILAQLQAMLANSGFNDVGRLAATYAATQVAVDHKVRLGQAGEGNNQSLPLEDVAVDLAATWVDADGTAARVSTVEHVVRHGNAILRPSLAKAGRPAHLALVGGPGQGKTTLSQLLCQVYRVSFLADAGWLADEDMVLLRRFRERMAQLGIPEPVMRRWPVRINLAEYADALAGAGAPGLLRYLADQVSEAVPSVSPNGLREWLGRWPWLLVLDGLDEVAAAAARADVLVKLKEFLTDARQCNADLLIVSTTRPQGYRQEFAASAYTHLHLAALGVKDGLAYADRLAGARFEGDPIMARKVLDRLRAASRDPLTARLMTTPLQITIMSVLLERRERVPQERYRLFHMYYDTVFAREVAKPGPTAQFLDRYRRLVDRIHAEVGLRLQVASEDSGHSDAVLTLEELEAIAIELLLGEGHVQDADLKRLVERLVTVATQRLVLLAPRLGSAVGFDVRSLQEFMAAQAISSDQGADVAGRLRVIARSAHWRNTWLLAAGDVFYQQGVARHHVMTMLQSLGMDCSSALVGPGALLAVDLLNDEVASGQPRFQQLLTKLALELLDLPPMPEEEAWPLVTALHRAARSDSACAQLLERSLERALRSTGTQVVTAVQMLQRLETHSDGVGAKARQQLALARRRLPVDMAPVIEHMLLPDRRGQDRRPVTETNLKKLLAPFPPPSDAKAAKTLDAGLADTRVTLTDVAGSPEVVTGLGEAPHPPKGLEDVYMEAFAHIAETVPVHHWLVATALRDMCARTLERRPAGPDLLDIMRNPRTRDS